MISMLMYPNTRCLRKADDLMFSDPGASLAWFLIGYFYALGLATAVLMALLLSIVSLITYIM